MAIRFNNPRIEPAETSASSRSPDQTQLAADDRRLETIPDEHRASVVRGLADLREGRIATAAEIEAVYRSFGR